MKKLFIIFIIVLAFSACGNNSSGAGSGNQTNMSGYPFSEETITPESLFEYITVEEPYTEWEYWPGHEGRQAGMSPHGAYHEVFINSVISDVLPLEEPVIPEGGIIVKENYNSDGDMLALTVMTKLGEGFYPEGGDWYWGKYVLMSGERVCGRIESCAICHSSKQNNDYIMVYDL